MIFMELPVTRIQTFLLVLGLASLPWAAPAGAQPMESADASSVSPAEILDVAKHYLETLYRFDFAALRELIAEEVVFDDPTSTYFGGEAWHFEGPDELVGFFERSSAGTSSNSFEVVQEFATASYAVLTVVYVSAGDGGVVGAPGVAIELRVPAVTIVEVRDGLVVRHLDHVDYASMMAQVEAQKRVADVP